VKRVKKVFVSFAVKDLYEVLGRLQGLKVLSPDVDIFMDVYSLKQGEAFKERILEEVMSRETFLLFWSRNAAASAWVEWEWRTALARESVTITPVPLEPAAKAPPPPELSDRHFNDFYSYHAHLLKELEQLQEELARVRDEAPAAID